MEACSLFMRYNKNDETCSVISHQMAHHMELDFPLKQRCCVVRVKTHAGYCPQILDVLQLIKT